MNKNMWRSHAEVMLRQPVVPPQSLLHLLFFPLSLKEPLSLTLMEGVGPNISITRVPGRQVVQIHPCMHSLPV